MNIEHRGDHHAEMYMEKPRADLYSTIKKLKEKGGMPSTSPSRLLYIAKIADAHAKDHLEKEFQSFFKDFVEEQGLTGFCLIVGTNVVHLMEAEREQMKIIVQALHDKVYQEDGSMQLDCVYSQVRVIHHCDENAERAFEMWNCKGFAPQGSGNQTNEMEDHEKYWKLYDTMC